MCCLAFACSAAAETPLLPAFDKFCLSQNLPSTDIEAQARAEGYLAPPAQIMGEIPAPFKQGRVLWKPAEGSAMLVVVAENLTGVAPYPARLCSMALMPGRESDLSDFEKLIGLVPMKSPQGDMYLFKEVEGRRIPASAAEMTRAERAKGNNVLLGVGFEGGVTMVMVARPLRSPPPAP